jgi:hypothetical protein
MRSLSLDFKASSRHYPWLGPVILAVSIVTSVLLYVEHSNLKLRQAEVVADITRLQNEARPDLPAPDTLDEAEAETLKSMNDTKSKLNTAWPALFTGLEDSREEDIDLLEVGPDPMAGSLRLVGLSADLPKVLGYIERLKQQPGLENPKLVDHQSVMRNGLPAVRFEIISGWKAVQP